MDREVKVFVNELCTADKTFSVFKIKGSDTWQGIVADSTFNSEAALEAYENAPVIKIMKASEAPSEILEIMRELATDKQRFDKVVANGREVAYVEDADGDTSYNFVMYSVGEYYRMYQSFDDQY